MEAAVTVEQEKVTTVTDWLSKRIIGQETLLQRLRARLQEVA